MSDFCKLGLLCLMAANAGVMLGQAIHPPAGVSWMISIVIAVVICSESRAGCGRN